MRAWLKQQGKADALIGKVLHALEKAAGDISKSLYDRNRAVYELLRYGVKVRPDVGENNVTVWLVDWKQPENNDFAIAEEVTVTAADAKAHGKRPDAAMEGAPPRVKFSATRSRNVELLSLGRLVSTPYRVVKPDLAARYFCCQPSTGSGIGVNTP